MKGLEIAELFYETYGKVMLETEFPDKLSDIAVGLVGEGSECLGYDDEISKDHDFDPGFCIWLNKKDYDEFGFKLERAYAKLPKEFMGLKRSPLSPSGGNRRGVILIDDFYTRFLGAANAPDSVKRWLYTPSSALLTASCGKVFKDDKGEFSAVREVLKKGYPEDIRLKKIAAHTAMMAQSGQYNYQRLIKREESGSAQLAVFEFVRHCISVIYLLNNAYEPFYKWAYRGMRDLKVLGDLELSLIGLTELGNSNGQAMEKCEIIDDIARLVIDEFKEQRITDATCNNLDTHAFSVTDKIKDPTLRNMHVMEGI